MESDERGLEMEHMDAREALAGLRAVEEQRARMGDRVVTPWWYHPALGLLLGGFVASLSLRSGLVEVAALAVFAVGAGLLVHAYRRITGVWVSGFRKGPAGRVSLAMLAVLYALVVAAGALEYAYDVRGAVAVAGAVVVPVTIVFGRRFDVTLREELRT